MSLDVYLKTDWCAHCGRGDDVYDCNITHNLGRMADEAGVYKVLWRAPENGIQQAGQLIDPLAGAVADMEARPEYYKQFNAENGWGLYKHFLPWLRNLLDACQQWPEATVRTSR